MRGSCARFWPLALCLLGAGRLLSGAPGGGSVRCLDVQSGEEMAAGEVAAGTACMAEITGPLGVTYQYLSPGASVDWDAVAYSDVALLVSPSKGRLVAGEPLLLRVQLTAGAGLPAGSRLVVGAPRGVLLGGAAGSIALPALPAGETVTLELPVASLDPSLIGQIGLSLQVESAAGSPLSALASVRVEVLPDRLFSLGMVEGRAWRDLDGDGVWDADEAAASGVTVRFENGTTATTDQNGLFSADGLSPGPRVAEVVAVPSGWQPAPGAAVAEIFIFAGGLATASFPLVPDEGRAFVPRAGLGMVGSMTLGAGGLSALGALRWRQALGGMLFEISYGQTPKDWGDAELRRHQPAEVGRWLYGMAASGRVSQSGGGQGLSWTLTGDRGALGYGQVRARRGGLAAHDLRFNGVQGSYATPSTRLGAAVATEAVQQGEDAIADTGGFTYFLRDVERVPGTVQVRVQVRDAGRVLSSWPLRPFVDYTLEGERTVRLTSRLADLAADSGNAVGPGESLALVAEYDWIRPADTTPTWTGRVERDLMAGLVVGATVVSEEREEGSYRLEGQDIAFAWRGFVVDYEAARSKTEDAGTYISNDGGLTYTHQAATAPRGWREATRTGVGWAGGDWSASWSRERLEGGFSARGISAEASTETEEVKVGGVWWGWGATASWRTEERGNEAQDRQRAEFSASRGLFGGTLSLRHDRRRDPRVSERLVGASWRGLIGSGLNLQASHTRWLADGGDGDPETDLRLAGSLAGGEWSVRRLQGRQRHLLETRAKGDLFGHRVDLSLSREVRANRAAVHRLVSRRGHEAIGDALAIGIEDTFEEQGGNFGSSRSLTVAWRPAPLHEIDARLTLRDKAGSSGQEAEGSFSGRHGLGAWTADWRASNLRDRLGDDRLVQEAEVGLRRTIGSTASLRLTADRRREEVAGATKRRTSSLAAGLSWNPRRNLGLTASVLRLRDEGWLGSGDHDVYVAAASWRPGRLAVTGRLGVRLSRTPAGEQRTRLGSLGVGYSWHKWSLLGEFRQLSGDQNESGQRIEVGYGVTAGLRIILGATMGGADDVILSPDGQSGFYLRLSGAV
ncbi:hypothetical protein IIA16_02755 [bacterium]|nr:hypothetical protein [bacterium]